MKNWFLFAHGAGAPSGSTWMQAWRRRLAELGEVTCFDYPYMRARRKAPDKLPMLIAAHREALAKMRMQAGEPSAKIFLIGKSMGGRVGCHVALEDPVNGLVCLGYPLVSGSSGAVRDEVLLGLRRPILFVQGSRDPLCPLDTLEKVRRRMSAPSELFVVAGGNHSLELPGQKTKQDKQEAIDRAVLEAIRRFVDDIGR